MWRWTSNVDEADIYERQNAPFIFQSVRSMGSHEDKKFNLAAFSETGASRATNRNVKLQFLKQTLMLKSGGFERCLFFSSKQTKMEWLRGVRTLIRSVIKDKKEISSDLAIFSAFQNPIEQNAK